VRFKNREEAGRLLSKLLRKYRNKNVVVFALPRGGVVTAFEIAKFCHAPLDLIITRKIGHPESPEYGIAATAENGHILGERKELKDVSREWLKLAVEKEREEAKRRREKYSKGRKEISVKGKNAILVDDGIATGLTMRTAIMELKHKNPKKIIIAVPVLPKSTFEILKKEVDEVISIIIPKDSDFLGAVGNYYENFPQISDSKVLEILKNYRN